MACTCQTLQEYSLNCKPSIGGIKSVKIDDVAIQTLPESSSFNSVMTYDKVKNLRYWTTDATINIGTISSEGEILCENLACPTGRTIEFEAFDGRKISIKDAFIQTATFNHGAAKTDGSDGVLVFQAITKDGPYITPANE